MAHEDVIQHMMRQRRCHNIIIEMWTRALTLFSFKIRGNRINMTSYGSMRVGEVIISRYKSTRRHRRRLVVAPLSPLQLVRWIVIFYH